MIKPRKNTLELDRLFQLPSLLFLGFAEQQICIVTLHNYIVAG